MDELRDALHLLGVRDLPCREEVTRAFRVAAKRHHPDVGGDAAQFGRLQSAYRVALAGVPPRRHRAYATAVAPEPTPPPIRRTPPPRPVRQADFGAVFARQLRRHGL